MVTALVRRALGCAVVISIDRLQLLGAPANCGTAGSGAARGLGSERGRCRHAYGPARTGLTAWTICGDRGAYGGWLSARRGAPAARAFGGCVGGLWLEQAHADQPPVAIDALDRVSVQLELTDDGCREVNPAIVQLSKGERLVAGLAQTGATGRAAAVVGDLGLAGGRRAATRARGLDALGGPRRLGGGWRLLGSRRGSAARGVMGAQSRVRRYPDSRFAVSRGRGLAR
jgi:hypothetical protein